MTALHDHDNLGGSNRLLGLAETARLLGIEDPLVLRRHRNKWGIPWLKTGRDIKFRERDIHAWIAKRVAS